MFLYATTLTKIRASGAILLTFTGFWAGQGQGRCPETLQTSCFVPALIFVNVDGTILLLKLSSANMEFKFNIPALLTLGASGT